MACSESGLGFPGVAGTETGQDDSLNVMLYQAPSLSTVGGPRKMLVELKSSSKSISIYSTASSAGAIKVRFFHQRPLRPVVTDNTRPNSQYMESCLVHCRSVGLWTIMLVIRPIINKIKTMMDPSIRLGTHLCHLPLLRYLSKMNSSLELLMSSVTESVAISWDIRGRYKASLDSMMVLIQGKG